MLICMLTDSTRLRENLLFVLHRRSLPETLYTGFGRMDGFATR